MPSGPSVLHLFVGSIPGGVLRYAVQIADATRRAGVDVLLAGQHGQWHQLVQQRNLPWLEIPIRGGVLDLWRSARVLHRHLEAHPPTIIHAHHRRATIVARLAQCRLGPPTIAPILYSLHMPGIPMGLPWRLFTDFGDWMHVPSQGAKRWALAQPKVDANRLTVIPHGIDTDAYPLVTPELRQRARARHGVPEGARCAAFLGRLEPPKNPLWTLDVASAARAAGLDLHLLIVGDGELAATLRDRIERDHLGDRVHLLGTIDAMDVLPAADLLLVPSLTEGFSLAAGEAMSCGIPILRTRTGGCEEMVIEATTGRSVDVDAAEFCRVALEMLSDAPGLARMGQAAARHVREHLTVARQVQSTLALYRDLPELLRRSSASPH